MSRVGLSGVTLGVLAERVGMSKSGLFAHFKSKEEVQVGLLEYMNRVGQESFVRKALAEPEGLPRLKALVRGWFGWAQRAGLPGGCPVAAGLFEFDDIGGPVRDKIFAMENSWRALLTRLVNESVSAGHLRADVDIEQFVWELCGIYLSHHAAHRFLRSADADERANKAFDSLIERTAAVAAEKKRERKSSRSKHRV